MLTPHTGIARTTPGIDAFKGDRLQRQVWGLRNLDAPTVSNSIEALPRIIAIEKLSNRLLADNAASIAPYVGTAAVAHDMLSIVEALGQSSFVQNRCFMKLISSHRKTSILGSELWFCTRDDVCTIPIPADLALICLVYIGSHPFSRYVFCDAFSSSVYPNGFRTKSDVSLLMES